MQKRTIALASAVIVLLAIGVMLLWPSDHGRQKTRIGYQALAGSWVFYVANERLPGNQEIFFEAEGLDVEAVRFESANMAAEAMLRGDVATDSALTMTVLYNIEEQRPGTFKCFGFQVHTEQDFLESVIASKGSGIQQYPDLKGKKIGVFPGSLNQSITRLLLAPYLDVAKDVEIVQLSPALQLQALTTGQVDALMSYEPTTTLALENGVADLVEHSPWARRIFSPFPVATYCFTTKFLDGNREIAEKVVRAWWRAIDFIREHPEVALNTIPKYTGIDPAIVQLLNQPLQIKSTEAEVDSFEKLSDLYMDFGLVSRPVSIKDVLYLMPEPSE